MTDTFPHEQFLRIFKAKYILAKNIRNRLFLQGKALQI
jgi:hypothetical protein